MRFISRSNPWKQNDDSDTLPKFAIAGNPEDTFAAPSSVNHGRSRYE